jgi:hypothetical protein
MKAKAFLLLCLILGIGLTQISAQVPPVTDGTRSLVWSAVYQDAGFQVTCDNVNFDILVGDITVKETDLFKDGIIIRGEAQFRGELTSQNSGEVFTLRDASKGWGPLDQFGFFSYGSYRWNMIGDKGTHYLADFSYGPDYLTIEKLTCPGKSK